MASRRDKNYVEKALQKLDDINDNVQDKKQELNNFLDELMEEMGDSDCFLLENSHYLYSGSSYERSAVHDETDFDILLILPDPFKADDFELIECHKPGFCKLRQSSGIEGEFKKWFNKNGFLKTQELRDYIFDELSEILKNIKRMNSHWSLRMWKQISTLVVRIKDDAGNTLKIDVVPALSGCDLNNIPSMRSLQELPEPLVQKHYNEYYLTLAAAPFLKDKNDYHLLVTVGFAAMEKTCIKSSSSVLNAVRLVKLTSYSKGWKKDFGFLSVHVKRVAIKHYEDLDSLSNWDAYKSLLKYIADDLRNGEIDGFFLYDQNKYNKDEEKGKELGRIIREVERRIQPNHLLGLFRE